MDSYLRLLTACITVPIHMTPLYNIVLTSRTKTTE